jgi:hypothetical protein
MASYDFFLAHAGKDAAQAERLYDLLSAQTSVFLDDRSLLLGDDWDRELAAAQRNSRVTVVLVSASTDGAFYQREEIATAIALARANGTKHRVVPVYLDIDPTDSGVPYGLRAKVGLRVCDDVTLEQAAARLLGQVAGRPPEPAALDVAVPAASSALEEALARVVPWVFRDPRIAAERLAKAKAALESIGPLIAACREAAMRETGQPMRYNLQRLDHALRTGQTAVAGKLSALENVRSEDAARKPCADLAEQATGLLDACARAARFVT